MDNLTPQRWQQVRALLDKALEHPPEQRAVFLEEACGDDLGLRAEVEALLSADAQAGAFLHDPVQAFAGALLAELHTGATPEQERLMRPQVGPYRLLKVIGHGGMGTVYLAERADEQFEQQVAVKLLRRGLDTEDVIRRFLAERQILASLNHPHIARLLDGGVTEPAPGEPGQGQPYFVMEYVEGRSLIAYCDAQRCTIEERLALFCKMGMAVQFAHRNLVVHRDLKPSNILVTDEGQVKLLDFGIAKLLLEEAARSAAPKTRTGQRWMTPEYAAPEQIRGEAVTTATDVYQLGVVLYELLTGRRPFEGSSRNRYEREQAVLHEAPEKPSIAVTRLTEPGRDEQPGRVDVEQVSRARSTQPARLQRVLRGDLDVIVLKALRKEPEARYASAEAFVEDVKRYLAGQPVTARRGTVGYRARKFIRRHRWGVAAAGVIALLLIGYAGTVTVQAGQVRRALGQATLEAAKSEQVTAFMMGLFEANDPREALGDTLTGLDLLARGVGRVEQLTDQPEVQAEMLDVMGRVYQSLGKYDEARPLLERALARRRALLGEEHPDVAESLNNLAALLRRQGDYAAAEPLYREALAMRRRLLGEEHSAVAESLNNLALQLREKGDYAAAEPLYREAQAMYRKLLGGEHPFVATTLSNLATLLHDQGDYAAAEPLYRETLAMRRRLLGEEHPDVAGSLGSLAALLRDQGDLEAAEPLYQEALAMRRRLLGEEHPDVARSLNSLAMVLRRRGDYAAAEPLYRETLAMRRRLLGEEHPDVAQSLNNLAMLLRDQGDLEAAELLYREALGLLQKLQGEEHLNVTYPSVGLARVLIEQRRAAEAEPFLHKALARRQHALPDEHWRVAEAKSVLGACLTAQARYVEAEPLLLEAHAALQQRGDQDRYTKEARERLVALYEAWGKPDQAAAYRVFE